MTLIKRFVLISILPLLALAGVHARADEVSLDHAGLKLNASWMPAGEDWQTGPVLLMTHGTLAHGGMEIMATLQELFADAGMSSLSITLGLGLSDRHGMYDCATLHTHRHTDALDEIGLWLQWLKEQGEAGRAARTLSRWQPGGVVRGGA